MVAKFAPQFSNIFMAGLESDMFEQSKKEKRKGDDEDTMALTFHPALYRIANIL